MFNTQTLISSIETIRFYRAVKRYPASNISLSLGDYVAIRSLLLLSKLSTTSQKEIYPLLLRSFFKELHAYAGEFVFMDQAKLTSYYPSFVQEVSLRLDALFSTSSHKYKLASIWEEAQSDMVLATLDHKLDQYFLYGQDETALFDAEELKLLKLAERMRHIRRYSGVVLITNDFLLEHTHEVGLLSALMMLSYQDNGWMDDLNPGVVIAKALVHDLDEAIYGDVIRPVKYGVEGLRQCLEDLSREYLQNFFPYLTGLWTRAKSGESGALVKFADLLSVLLEIYEERTLGSSYILKTTKDYPIYMNQLSEFFQSRRGPLWNRLSQLSEEAGLLYNTVIKDVGKNL